MKSFLTAAGLCIALIISLASPARAAEPQENPDTTPVVYDGVSLLQKYSQVLDGVLAADPAAVQQLQDQAAAANLPPQLETAVGSFFSSASSFASLLPSLQQDLADAQTFLEQYRVDDANQVLAEARGRLGQAYSDLLAMNMSALDTGGWWNVDAARAGSPLRQAYDDVQAKLLRLRLLLDLNENIDQITNDQLMQLYENIRQAANNQTSLLRFSTTNLSLFVEPAAAFVGENVSFHGILSSGAEPLAGRKVTILLDHSPVMTVTTGTGGDYAGVVTLPFRYSSTIRIQAVYSPAGDDIRRYLGCSSPEVTVNVLFYQTVLNVFQDTPANPGRDFLVHGAFGYGNNTVLPERRLNVYLDNDLIFDGTVGTGFSLNLPVAANTSVGTHNLTFDVPGAGRYAPTLTSFDIEVSRIVPVVEVNTPKVILLPFSQQIRGSVSSTIGPLADTAVEITLGNWRTAARTGPDGSFSARLGTGLSLTTLGSQDLRVTVTPTEPWYQSVSTTVSVQVVNPVNIAGMIIILLVPVFLGIRRRRKAPRPAVPEANPAFEPGPVWVTIEKKPVPPAAPSPGDVRSVILSLYRGILRFVQQVTGMILPPEKTLREFAAENEPKLGLIGGYFREFTLMIERLLYSRHDFEERDVTHARELSDKVRKGAGDENS